MRVLIADAPYERAQALADLILDAAPNARCVCVAELAQALKESEQLAFDVALSGLLLEDAAGVMQIERLWRERPHMPVVAVVSGENEPLAWRALKRGAQDYIVRDEETAPGVLHALRFAIERHHLRPRAGDQPGSSQQPSLLDPQTGLYNRNGLFIVADPLLQLAARLAQTAFAVVIEVVDTSEPSDDHSPNVVKLPLHGIAQMLVENCRSADVIGRVGENELAVVGVGEVEGLAKRLRRDIKGLSKDASGDRSLQIRIGHVALPQAAATSVDELIKQARIAAGSHGPGDT